LRAIGGRRIFRRGCSIPPTYHILTPRSQPELLSIVIPIYNEQAALPELQRRLCASVETLACAVEIITVNDGSRDCSLRILADWAQSDRRVKVIGLARNFGHQAAVTAGLDVARGGAVVIMDADLQDPPELIGKLLQRYAEGYDVVYAQRQSRLGESVTKRLCAWTFYRLMRMFVHRDLPADVGDFRLLSRACLEALNSMRETHRFLRGMMAWTGFPQTAVLFDRPARCAGRTNYSFPKMLQFAWTAAVSFSPAPLRVSMFAGFVLAMLGISDGAYAVVRKLLGHPLVPGWASLMAAMCVIGGGILLSIGVLGEYIGRIFEEVKGRPLYFVSYRANLDANVATMARSSERHRDTLARQLPERVGRR
jgi:glycosyltransferase involved in cell wall biosynthesis